MPWKKMTCLYIVNAMIADDLAMQEARGLIEYKDAILPV